jgi:pyruvate/2-oxoglutarate dehydrogenase complex dihydrolipoamide dehydrogenase (E3) component
MAQDTFDVVVVGGGPVGENAAARAVRGGLTAALVEQDLYGGECSYWACMPSKALLRPIELRQAALRMPGVPVGDLEVDKVLARRDSFTHHWDDSGQEKWVVETGIVPVRGHGRLGGERTVEVTGRDGEVRTLSARRAVVLATGTTAAIPPIEGLGEARPWISRDATSVRKVPRRLVVLGGGVVACEMAQAMKGLHAEEVTVLERGDRLLGRMEPWAGELVADGLRAVGVTIRTGTKVVRVHREGGEVTVSLADGTEVVGDEVLCALGRRPATTDVGLDTVGLEPGSYLQVDDSLRVDGVDWLYAAGDVNGRNLLTHMGKYQARICGDVIAARAKGEPDDSPKLRATADHDAVPQVVFTDPQACSVGLTEAKARERGIDVRVVSHDPGQVAGGSLEGDGYAGRASLVVDQARGVVVGATFVAPEIAELLHSATVAIVGQVPLERLWHAVPSYPTVSEVWLRLLEELGL